MLGFILNEAKLFKGEDGGKMGGGEMGTRRGEDRSGGIMAGHIIFI